jgi:hypothetical protein
MSCLISAVAVVVGLPVPVRAMVERLVAQHICVRTIPLKRDGGFKLESPPRVAADLVVQFADQASSYTSVLIVVLPYTSLPIPDEVWRAIETLKELGARVCRPQSGAPPWPARVVALDNQFQKALAVAVADSINSTFPEEPISDVHREISMELLRGLASHSKMGPNNHSHEDDLWKSRGHNLGPSERTQIVGRLMREGILDRKKNNSAGGTGWVYWIADVQKTRTQYPELEPYFH